MHRSTALREGDALLIIDVQLDFLPGGALAVPAADAVVPVLSRYLAAFRAERLPTFASRDWHPDDHSSFHEQGGPWPRHAVADTTGAEFPIELALPPGTCVVSKGTERAHEAYSAFSGTDLEERLRAAGVTRLFVGGLATDYCVLHTVRDALQRGFEVVLLRDAIAAVNLEADDGRKAEQRMREAGASDTDLAEMLRWRPSCEVLLTDFYQLTMVQGYLAAKMEETAAFEFFVRRLPPGWNFLVAAGLEQVLDFLEDLRFSAADCDWLAGTGAFSAGTIERLRGMRFTGDVDAMPEGTVFFPDEPVLRVEAPIAEAQFVESRVLNLVHFQTLLASKAVRSVLAAPGKRLVDFGLRRAHGAEAGLLAARATYLAGFHATSNVLAAARLGIPVAGTMAHSFVEACASEEEAFARMARANPRHVVLLIDTYDTEAAAQKVVHLAPTLQAQGIRIEGVRLDSGDLAEHARKVRRILDDGGLGAVTIFASGSLDEQMLQELIRSEAPIDGFGIGSRVVTPADAPYLDCAYKLQAYAGVARCKWSEQKATWPGEKQVFRRREGAVFLGDTIALAGEPQAGEPLLEAVMRGGRRLQRPAPLAEHRARLERQVAALPAELRGLGGEAEYPVRKSEALHKLARALGVREAEGAALPRPTEAPPPRLGFLRRIYADATPVVENGEAVGRETE